MSPKSKLKKEEATTVAICIVNDLDEKKNLCEETDVAVGIHHYLE